MCGRVWVQLYYRVFHHTQNRKSMAMGSVDPMSLFRCRQDCASNGDLTLDNMDSIAPKNY